MELCDTARNTVVPSCTRMPDPGVMSQLSSLREGEQTPDWWSEARQRRPLFTVRVEAGFTLAMMIRARGRYRGKSAGS